MRELLGAMKQIYGKQAGEMERMRAVIATGGGMPSGDGFGGDGGDGGGGGGDAEGDGVGESDQTGKRGIAVGKAPDGARPAGGLIEPPSTLGGGGGDEGAETDGPPVLAAEPGGTMDKQEAYVQYKMSEGALINQRLISAKKALRESRAKRAECASLVNKYKLDIDAIKVRIESKKMERTQINGAGGHEEAEIIDEEEYSFIQVRPPATPTYLPRPPTCHARLPPTPPPAPGLARPAVALRARGSHAAPLRSHRQDLKTAKQQYKQSHSTMTQATQDAAAASLEVSEARTELITTFNEWYAASFHETAEPSAPIAREVAPPTETMEPGDTMDDDERFEQLQMARVMAEAPESLAFVRARKNATARQQQRGLGASRRK